MFLLQQWTRDSNLVHVKRRIVHRGLAAAGNYAQLLAHLLSPWWGGGENRESKSNKMKTTRNSERNITQEKNQVIKPLITH